LNLKLGNFPTPIQNWSFKVNGKEYNLLIKRDDLSDLTASGNKIRKLEFILPEVAEGSYDWIVSVGGTQSNHCR
jgi:1-aminocyclopropane-1-carboxylate deaminase/D-cysteine desulfhydrase-like pyridoxal-dependent ACC family enzyme